MHKPWVALEILSVADSLGAICNLMLILFSFERLQTRNLSTLRGFPFPTLICKIKARASDLADKGTVELKVGLEKKVWEK